MKTTHFIGVLLLVLLTQTGFSAKPVSLSGIIKDAESGKVLNDINIVVKEKATGTISDFSGNYLLHLDQGTYDLEFSGKGYQNKEITVELIKDQEIEIKLSKSTKKRKHMTKLWHHELLSKK